VTYAPSASSAIMITQKPSLSSSMVSGDAAVRIKHREFVQDVSGSIAFAVSQLSVNPGDPTTFPWLSTIASNYESYLFRTLAFEYETFSPTTTSGTVMLAIDYDAADAPPADKVDFMTYHGAVRSAAWQECCYSADRQDLEKFGKKRYVRTGGLAANLDIKTYDVGNLFVAAQGMAGASTVGELYVVYDVELETPQRVPNFTVGNSARVQAAASSLANPFAGGTVTGGLPIVVHPSFLVFNQVGQYYLTFNSVGTTFNANPNIAASTAAVTLVDGNEINAAATDAISMYTVVVTVPGQSFSAVWTGGAATCTSTDTRITAYLASLG